MTDRAYSLLEVKSVDDESRVITGIATTPTPDRVGDIVEPMGASFAPELPLLWQHRHDQPVGTVKFGKPTDRGIPFTATIAKIAEEGALKSRVDEAWQSVKARLVRAVSIGFRALEYAFMDDGGTRFTKTEIMELSLVTIPANAQATIQSIKQFDAEAMAATGRKAESANPPGATGSKPKLTIDSGHKEANKMKTIAEQIAAFKSSRDQKSARMTEIMNKSAEEGQTLDEAQTEEYDGLDAEVKSIDAHVKRLESLEANQVKSATPVKVEGSDAAAAARGGVRVEVKGVNLPKGTTFTRYAMALARSKGNLMQAAEVAKTWRDSTPEVETVLKAAVAAGTTTDADWAKPLVEYQNMTSEFAELLRPQTIIGRIPGFRNVPFNIKIPRQTAGSTAAWVGEGAPKPVSELAFDQITLGMTKLAGIVVITDELARASSPSAEAIVRQDLLATIAYTMDRDFVDPANAGTTNVKPASIINGVTPVTASGTDADDLRADVKALYSKYLTANMSLEGAVWIMNATTALGISMMVNALGQFEFPTVNGQGGTLFGVPVVVSENIPANPGTGSPLVGAGSRIILVKASEIIVADDGQTLLDVSREASLQMDSAPTNPPVAATVMTSLWQMNLVGIRAERFINWGKRRAGAAQWIDSANYGS